MLSTKEIFLIAALLCFVMFLVIYAFESDRVHGTSELLLANVLGMGAYVLYAFGRELPPLIAYETANALYASASAAIFVSFRRLAGRDASVLILSVTVGLLVTAIGIFHYIFDSFAWRTALVSLFQAGIAVAIARTILVFQDIEKPSGYVRGLIVTMCIAIAGGHLFRAVRQFTVSDVPQSLLEPTGWNHFYLAASVFAMPVLTLGGLLLAHRAIVAVAEHAANRDFLTTAWSRRAFFDIGERDIARAKRTGKPLCLMLIDLDRLKEINDTQGHAAGDRVLCEFVDSVTESLRTIDWLARLGGDEFVIVMPDTDLAGASIAAQRLRTKLKHRANSGVGQHDVTVSIGIAVLRSTEQLDGLLQRADKALYEAKGGGRDRIVLEPNVVLAFNQRTIQK